MSPKAKSTSTPSEIHSAGKQALTSIEAYITKQGIFAKGREVNTARVVGQQLANALADVDALADELAKRQAALTDIVEQAKLVVAGTHPNMVKPTKSNGAAGDATTTEVSK